MSENESYFLSLLIWKTHISEKSLTATELGTKVGLPREAVGVTLLSNGNFNGTPTVKGD
jgi:hypothetical protein